MIQAARWLAASLLIVVVAGSLWGFPRFGAELAAGLLLWGACAWWSPRFWLWALPAAVAVLDLAPWTGRFFWDELDFAVLVVVAIGLVRHRMAWPQFAPLGRPALLALAVVWVIGLAVSTLSLRAFDANATASYLSPYNGLRVAKGALWALVLVPFYGGCLAEDSRRAVRAFAGGMVLCLVALTLSLVWERIAVVGGWGLDAFYRPIGVQSNTNVGGAYLEGLFVLTLPFALWWVVFDTRRTIRVAAAAVFLAGSLALLFTHARAAYLALGVSGAFFILAAAPLRRTLSEHPGRVLAMLAGAAIIVASIAVVGQSRFIELRWMRSAGDLAMRLAQWQEALEMLADRPVAFVLGTGTGSFAREYAGHARRTRLPATFSYLDQDGTRFLRVSTGTAVYVEQVVELERGGRYRLELRARAPDPALLTVPVCRKWLLQSEACVWSRLAVASPDWTEFTAEVDADRLVTGNRITFPIKLSLVNRGSSGYVDVTGISMRRLDGPETVRNGDFRRGSDYWFWSSDAYASWHVHNLALHILFEHGLIGLSVSAMLLLAMAAAAFRRLADGDEAVPPLVAAMAGFLVIGLIDSLVDSPRVALLAVTVAVALLAIPRRRRPDYARTDLAGTAIR